MPTALWGIVALAASPVFLSAAPPPAEPRLKAGSVQWFTLAETPKQLQAVLGEPAMVAESGSRWVSLQYRLGEVEHEDFSHQFLFERGSGRLLSVTRNYADEHDVSRLFPAQQTTLHYYPNAEQPQLTLRLRRLPDGRVLTALGASGGTTQIVLTRQAFLRELFPWLPESAPPSATPANKKTPPARPSK